MMNNLQDKLDKVPDPRLHQIISFAKSGVRIVSSVAAVVAVSYNLSIAVIILAAGYGVAEVIGVYEELV
jgi:hypothetical protein